MQKLVVSSVSIIGYLGVLMPMTAVTSRWIAEAVELNENGGSEVRGRLSPGYAQLSISAVLVLVSKTEHSYTCLASRKERSWVCRKSCAWNTNYYSMIISKCIIVVLLWADQPHAWLSIEVSAMSYIQCRVLAPLLSLDRIKNRWKSLCFSPS